MDFMNRHFTATGLIIKNDSVLLHLHPKIHLWLPPGGHVELNEDPVETVKREISEETGYKVQIINTSNTHIKKFKNVISIIPPHTIFIEPINDIKEGFHEHIDMIYLCKIVGGELKDDSWRWINKKEILNHINESYNQSSDIYLTDELINLCIELFNISEGGT
jgi:8-oxo-dGTP diphosphatase